MKRLLILIIMYGSISLHYCPLSAMEVREEKSLARIIKKDCYCIVRQVRHVRKATLESDAKKPRKIKLAERGISAPPSSPELQELQASSEIQNSPLMTFENPAEVPSNVQVACSICGDIYASCHELRDHMFYAHHTFLCACKQMYQDCDQYRAHFKTCCIFQKTKEEVAEVKLTV